MTIEHKTLAVVIPAFKAAGTIAGVIRRIPAYVDSIVVVDDASPDNLKKIVCAIDDKRIIYLRHEKNSGVGAAMVTGYRKTLDIGVDLIAKVDADGQMDPQYLNRFARVLTVHQCDYAKANRFGHLGGLRVMPKVRMIGSLFLSFMTKFASGYWNVFDPQNGYMMITRKALRRLNLNRIDSGYFFENSMLINLNIIKAKIGEIYLPAHYAEEESSMRIRRILLSFPLKLFSGFMYRIYQKYVFRSLSPYAVLALFGILAMAWGSLWGGWAWHRSIATGIPATTGTVILALLPLLLGWSALLQALVFDVQDSGPCLLFDYDDETLVQPVSPPDQDDRIRSTSPTNPQ